MGKEYLPTEHPDWDKPSDIKTALRRLPNGDYAFLMLNTASDLQKVEVPVKDILPFDTAYIFRWSHNTRQALGKQATISSNLKPGRVALFYLSQKDHAPARNMSIYGVETGFSFFDFLCKSFVEIVCNTENFSNFVCGKYTHIFCFNLYL